MRLFPYFVLLLLLNGCAVAQNAKRGLSKKDERTAQAARQQLDAGQPLEAYHGLSELIDEYPDRAELYFQRSLALRDMYRYEEAVDDVRNGIAAQGSAQAAPYRELGDLLSLAGRFKEAHQAYERYAELRSPTARPERQREIERLLQRSRTADSIAARPLNVQPEPVPGRVNTSEHFEYHPSLSADGQQLIFTRRIDRRQEDFYGSRRTADGAWGEAQPLAGINSPYDEGAQTLTADGSYLVYTSCNRPERSTGCDLYLAEWDGAAWTPGEPLPGSVNTPHYEAQPSLSQDGRYLIFSSKRPGGKGGADLYISARLQDGAWSAPSPIARLNTVGNEQYPFWAADGRTLFFTSDGHPGLGGDDPFYTKLEEDNTWSEPINLGYPINTAANETNMFVSLRADTAYYSKRYYDVERGQTQIDLWQFPLPRHLRPRPATYVRTRVVDRATGQALQADIRLQALDGSNASTQTTRPDGTALTVLPVGKEYAFAVDKPGYLFQSERFTIADGSPEEPFEIIIRLARPAVAAETSEEDGNVAFKNVLFTSGSAELLPVSYVELGSLARVLRDDPTLSVTIAGHTDNVGSQTDNLALSQARAAAVKAYLTEQGIAAERVRTEGYGEGRPVATNDTPEGRALNRRTTFRIERGN